MVKKDTIRLFSLVAGFLCASSLAHAQLIIPQIVDGGAWVTTLVITNTGVGQAAASLSFYQEIGGGITGPWNLTFVEPVQPQNFLLPAGSTLYLHTPGTASTTSVGWGQLTETDPQFSVVAYAIFTQRIPGRTDQDGTASAAVVGSRIMVPYDNTATRSASFATSIAIANPTPSAETISVATRNSSVNGAATPNQQLSIMLPPQGHIYFDFPTQFGQSVAGQSGLAEFYVSGGSISILALRFHSSGAFTTAPVYTAQGPPIIGSSQ
jgi:hypothetical protein